MLGSDQAREDVIRERAYLIWEREGAPKADHMIIGWQRVSRSRSARTNSWMMKKKS